MTMKQLLIEDDVYNLLVQSRIGFESESEVLRRLLGNHGASPTPMSRLRPAPSSSVGGARNSGLAEFLGSPEFPVHADETSKFLHLLSWLHRRNPDAFKAVTAMSGGSRRTRKYYGLNRQELEDSGKSVNPKQIPNSPYWVVTNNDTATKRKMLEELMRVLRYSSEDIAVAVSALKLSSEK